MTSAFILVITITIGLGSEQKTFQMSFPKESEAECMTEATGKLHSYVQTSVIQQSSGSQTPEKQGDATRVLVTFE